MLRCTSFTTGHPQLTTICLATKLQVTVTLKKVTITAPLHFTTIQHPHNHVIKIQPAYIYNVTVSRGHVIAICDFPAGFRQAYAIEEAGFA